MSIGDHNCSAESDRDGDREQDTRNRIHGTGYTEQDTRNREQGEHGNKELAGMTEEVSMTNNTLPHTPRRQLQIM